MNKRTVFIVNRLSKTEEHVTIAMLAEECEVSQRTIRNDLNAVNDMLREHGLAELELRSGGQIHREESFGEILKYISGQDYYSYKLSKEERKRIASVLLINSSEYITLSAIAENLFVSRATIINDLEDIKAYIKTGNMKVLSHPNKGLRVEGKESDKRLFLMGIGMQEKAAPEHGGEGVFAGIQAGNQEKIQKIISEQEHVHGSFLTDDSFQKLQMYLGIMVSRNMQGEYIEVRKKADNSKYRMAQDILKYTAQYCNITTTEYEIQFLSELLLMARYMKTKSSNQNAVKIQLVTRRFIECISEELELNLNHDYDFFENLSRHLESVFGTAASEQLENPMTGKLLEDNIEVFEAVKCHIDMIRQFAKREITEAEIGYVAVHVCAAVERKKNKEIAFHVIVACHGGIGTSQLLMEKLKKHFNFQIVDIVSSHETANITEEKADFIISTVPLKGCKMDYVIVTPMLNDEDYIRVGNKIDSLRNRRHLPARGEGREITATGLLKQIQPVIEEIVPGQSEILLKEIRKVLRKYLKQPTEPDVDILSPYLHHLLNEGNIQLDVECADWKDAVKKSAAKLLERGYIEPRYVDAMIANIEENGPYVVLSKGFAVPHEGLKQGSIKVGMNLIRLKNPVPFGAEELDPVEFVCCLSAVDHKTHLKAFFNLVNMLKDESFKEALRVCTTPKEAAVIIETYEYRVEE